MSTYIQFTMEQTSILTGQFDADGNALYIDLVRGIIGALGVHLYASTLTMVFATNYTGTLPIAQPQTLYGITDNLTTFKSLVNGYLGGVVAPRECYPNYVFSMDVIAGP